MEKQVKAFCLVHAFNMSIGENIFSGNQVLAHIQSTENILKQRRLHSKSLDHFFTQNMGNFYNNILNHFLHYLPWNHARHNMLKYTTSGYLKEGNITA